jgi:hypothetical protein
MLGKVVSGSAFNWCGKHRLCFWDGSFCIKKNQVIFLNTRLVWRYSFDTCPTPRKLWQPARGWVFGIVLSNDLPLAQRSVIFWCGKYRLRFQDGSLPD